MRKLPPRNPDGTFRRRKRRNPYSAQLARAYETDIGRVGFAQARGKAKSAQYWAKVAEKVESKLEDPEQPIPKEFVTFYDKFGNRRVRPLRYDLMSADKFNRSYDRARQERQAHLRREERHDREYAALPAKMRQQLQTSQSRLTKRVEGVNKRYAKAAATRAAIKAGTKVAKQRGSATQRERKAYAARQRGRRKAG